MEKPSAILIAILTLLTAIVSNIDRIVGAISPLFNSKIEYQMTGTWTGVFREYSNDTHGPSITSEIITIEQPSEKDIVGTIATTDEQTRRWTISGNNYNNTEYLVLRYNNATKGSNAGAGAIVLIKQNTDYETYYGWWVGYDTTLHTIVVNPYILSKLSASKIKSQHADYLKQGT